LRWALFFFHFFLTLVHLLVLALEEQLVGCLFVHSLHDLLAVPYEAHAAPTHVVLIYSAKVLHFRLASLRSVRDFTFLSLVAHSRSLVLQALGSEPLVPRCRERTDLLLNFRGLHALLAVEPVGEELALRVLGSDQPAALLASHIMSEFTHRSVVARASSRRPIVSSKAREVAPCLTTLDGADLRVCLGGSVGGADAVEEVGVLAIAVAVVTDHFLQLLTLVIILPPLAIVVR